MKKRILICDDEPQRQSRWRANLKAVPSVERAFEVVEVSNTDLQEAIKGLESRRKAARTRSSGRGRLEGNLFDSAAILVVDYDLLKLKSEIYLTGEGVAYLARCYSRCGLIVALNQYGDNVFDLSLKGHPESYADVNLGGSNLGSLGLWTDSWPLFRPWSWPQLPASAEALEMCIAQLGHRLDDRVARFLSVPDGVMGRIPRSIGEFLTMTDKPSRTTFRDFVMSSGNGFRPKDRAFSLESVARVAAAGVRRWLESLVLPGQDILVDSPHLVSRYPSLLTGDPKRVQSWNKTASFRAASRLGLRHGAIDSARFGREEWLSRAAWFWDALSNSEHVDEVVAPWTSALPDWVFCEDVSRFMPRGSAREFVADLPSPFVRRFVVDPSSKQPKKVSSSVRHVEYRPAVRFSL